MTEKTAEGLIESIDALWNKNEELISKIQSLNERIDRLVSGEMTIKGLDKIIKLLEQRE